MDYPNGTAWSSSTNHHADHRNLGTGDWTVFRMQDKLSQWHFSTQEIPEPLGIARGQN
jgi:hypothetical protein